MSLEQVRDLLDAGLDFRFDGKRREEMYDWMKETLVGSSITSKPRRTRGC